MASFSRLFKLSEGLFDKITSLSCKKADQLFIVLCASFLALQILLVAFSPLDLAADEAHYWDWSRNLDISYYSKGPGVALLIAGSKKIFGDTAFAVRAPAILCSLLLSIFIYVSVRTFYSAQIALLTFILARTALFFYVLGLVMTTDPPTMLFWFLSLVAAIYAVRFDKGFAWIFSGLFVGVTLLSKYTAIILFPFYFACLLFTPQARHHLKKYQFYLGGILALCFLIPMLVWNSQHEWVNFFHNSGHLSTNKSSSFTLKYLIELLSGQLGLVGPISFFFLVWASVISFRKWRAGDAVSGMLLFTSFSLAAVCLIVSLNKRVYANWPMPIYLSSFLLFAHVLSESKYREKVRTWFFISVGVNLMFCALPSGLFVGATYGLPAKVLTTKKLVGWSELARHVEKYSADNLSIIASEYEIASELAFYMAEHPKVLCANFGSRRMNHYDIWQQEDLAVGSNALVIVKSDNELSELSKYFTDVDVLEKLQIHYAGDVLQKYLIVKASTYKGGLFERPARY